VPIGCRHTSKLRGSARAVAPAGNPVPKQYTGSVGFRLATGKGRPLSKKKRRTRITQIPGLHGWEKGEEEEAGEGQEREEKEGSVT